MPQQSWTHTKWYVLASNNEFYCYRAPNPVLSSVKGVATSSKEEICLLLTAMDGLLGSNNDNPVAVALLCNGEKNIFFKAAELEKKILVAIVLANDCSCMQLVAAIF